MLAVYLLLPRKTEEMYRSAMTAVVDAVGDVSHVEGFSGDFEQAVINVVEDMLPNCTYDGCYFHLKHSVYMALQETRALTVLQCVPNFELIVNYIYVLPFVPPKEIVNVYEHVIAPLMSTPRLTGPVKTVTKTSARRFLIS